MEERRNSGRRVVVGITLAAALVSTTVLAGDGKRYPGSMCEFATDNGESNTRTGPKFQNKSGGTKAVVCPVLQERIDSDIEYAEIVASATIDEDTCHLYQRLPNGNYSYWSHDEVEAAGGSYNRTIWFPGGEYANSASGAAFHLKCALEDNKLILSYRMDDKT